jgi:hypothetical protein
MLEVTGFYAKDKVGRDNGMMTGEVGAVRPHVAKRRSQVDTL